MNNMMKRFFDENKETLWEQDLHDGLYQNAVDGSRGICKSPDGTYFYAEYHRNGFTYNGESKLRLLPKETALAAINANYDNDPWVENIPCPV